ncbi:MAG: hypothetical protein HY809_10435 [Nitrospirae bacterium]|nr:hypothetical protein [Nitrospirota bacterium]
MKHIYFLLLITALIPFACGKDEIQPSYDSVVATNAMNAVNAVREAYVAKDITALEQKLDKDLFKTVSARLYFENAELSFSAPRSVRISDPEVKVLLNWQGAWRVENSTRRDRGVSTMVFNIDTMKLIRIEGTNPLKVPGMN